MPSPEPRAPAATERSNEWDGLRPRNVVQAARADIERYKRNQERANDQNSPIYGDDYEAYAFLRIHVTKADGAFGLIKDALDAVIEDHRKFGPVPALVKKIRKTVIKREEVEVWVDPSLRGRIARSTKPHMKHLYNEALLRAALELEPLEKAW